jgi:PDDEXK-like domain of unknown function (DUF3799)
MGLSITNKEIVQAYYESEALSQSSLKKLLGNVSRFHDVPKETPEHFVLGKAVDCILTGNEGDFEEEYFVTDLDRLPSEAVAQIVKRVFEMVSEYYEEALRSNVLSPEDTFDNYFGDLSRHEGLLLSFASDWQPRWGDDAKVKNLLKEGSDYFQSLKKSFGKTILSLEQKNTINRVVESLRTNPRTARYFAREEFQMYSQVDVRYQLPLFFEYKGVKCKALLDMAIFCYDKEELVAIYPIDFKTMAGDTFSFYGSAIKYRYDIQGAWYTLALCQTFNLPLDSEKIKPFIFVVESTTSPGKPLAFQVEQDFLDRGKNGRPALYQEGVLVKGAVLGYEQLFEKYLYHVENGFALEKEIQDYAGEPIKLNENGIVTK